jgi:hypothetical protein
MKAHSAAIGKNPPTLEAPLQKKKKKKKETERHKDEDSMALMFVMDL